MPSHQVTTPGVGGRLRTARALSIAALTAVALGGGRPASGQQELSGSVVPPVPVDTFRLGNGLRVVVSEDHSAPLVAVNLWYGVGSAREGEGQRGLAQLVERLLVQETEHLRPGDLERLVTRAGGVYSAATGRDRTALVQVLPSNRLNLALWVMGEGMSRLRVDEAAVARQREAVEEARRFGVENRPYAGARLAVDTLSRDYPPYRHSPVASSSHLREVGAAEVEAFYRRYYVPANAVLAVVGDVSVDEVRSLAREFLGDAGGEGAVPELPEPTAAPRTGGERRAVVDDPLARLPLVWIAYTIPPADHPDRHALELLESILSPESGGPLRERLVGGVAVATAVSSELDLGAGPGALRFGAVAARGVDAERVEALLEEEVEGLGREEVDRELPGAVKRRRSALVGQLLTVRGRASALQWHTFYEGSPSSLDDEMARYRAVRPEDILRVARTYLTPENRTVVIARPSPPPAGEGR